MRGFRAGYSTLIGFVLGAAVGIYLERPAETRAGPLPPGVLLERILDQIDENYVDEVDLDEVLRTGLHRFLLQLDRNSGYIAPKDLVEFDGETRGFYVGIGIVLDPPDAKRRFPTVLRLVEGGPAARAGLLPGDQVQELGDRNLEGITLEELNGLLREREGKRLTLLVQRGEAAPRPIEVEIARVVYSSVKAVRLFGENETAIGYLRVQQFQDGTAADCRRALENLRAEGARSFVLDLRNNTGGILHEGIDLAALFLREGVILTTRGRGVHAERSYRVEAPGPFTDEPLCVLINNGSASASEVVSAALQDHHRAVLLGSPSYGKWTVQSVYSLGQDELDGRLKITTSSFHRPDQSRNQPDRDGHIRVIPDVEVPLDPGAEMELAHDWQSEALAHVDAPLAVVRHAIPIFGAVPPDGASRIADAPLIRAVGLLLDGGAHRRLLEETTTRTARQK